MLIKCSECGTEISSDATACPKCGAPVATLGRSVWGFGRLFVYGFIAVVVFYAVFHAVSSQQAYSSAAETAPASADAGT